MEFSYVGCRFLTFFLCWAYSIVLLSVTTVALSAWGAWGSGRWGGLPRHTIQSQVITDPFDCFKTEDRLYASLLAQSKRTLHNQPECEGIELQ
eukprot:3465614-Amphidinium_carterae.1